MSLRLCLLAAAVLLTACSEPDEDRDGEVPREAANLIPGELLVKFHQPRAAQPFEAAGYTLHPVKELGPNLWLMRLAGGLELHDAATLTADTLRAATALAKDARVAGISENARIPFALASTSNPLYSAQRWNYDTIHLPQAWGITTGKSSVRIAILDSGRTEHPDLSWGPGKDFIDGDDNPTAVGTYHHGIHVAGIVGALNNEKGGVGVCWGCTMLPWRTADETQNLYSAIIAALYWAGGRTEAGENGPRRVDVVNLSMSEKRACATYTAFGIRDAIEFAVSQGVAVVVAAGNFGSTYDAQFPANCPNTIAVAASAPGGGRATFSTRGLKVDITAPGGERTETSLWGEDIWGGDIGPQCPRYPADVPWKGTLGVASAWTAATATPGTFDHCYRYMSGTSMAAPHVAGVIGLMLSVNPRLTPARIEQILKTTAQPMSAAQCPQGGCGAGMLDAHAAVLAASDLTVTPAALEFGEVWLGNTLERTVTVTNRGPEPLTLTGVSASGAAFTVPGPLPGPIAAGASTSLSVRCVPASAAGYAGMLSIVSNGGEASVALSCQGVTPRLSVATTWLDFGDVRHGEPSLRFLTIRNTDTVPLMLSSATVTGTMFATMNGLPTEPMPPGASMVVVLRCQSFSTELHTGALTIVTDKGSVGVSLVCQGVAPVLYAPASKGFGDVQVGQSVVHSFAIQNTGTASLMLQMVRVNGAAFSLDGPTPVSLPPKSSGVLILRCQPPSSGLHTGTLELLSDGGSASVALSCGGIAPALPDPTPRLE